MEFEKYNGLGNDFIIVEENLSVEEVRKLCQRRFGIGADGLIVATKKNENYYMHFYNADGSLASMCGNGIRCYTHYLYNKKYIRGNNIKIDTLSGIKDISFENGKEFLVNVNMGKASNDNFNNKINILDKEFIYHYTNTGTEHIVIYLDNKNDLNEEFVNKYGSLIEQRIDLFPNEININFCYINDNKNISVITFERGVGVTYACGTGASAVAYISKLLFNTDEEVVIKLLGGNLYITTNNLGIIMKGKSEFVYKGSIEL